jgi:hypothetical protein
MWRRTGSGSGAAGSSAAGRCGVVRRWLTRRVARSASVRPESGVKAADARRRTGAARPGGIAALAAGLTAAATANARPRFSGRRFTSRRTAISRGSTSPVAEFCCCGRALGDGTQ